MSAPDRDWLDEVLQLIRSKLNEEGEPISCRLHELTGPDGHHCLGCNFAENIEGLEAICSALLCNSDLQDRDRIKTILSWLNPIVDSCMHIWNVAGCDNEKFHEAFKNFNLVSRWMNFFKHPKAFLFTHHATYGFEKADSGVAVTIDCEFVKKFFGGGRRNVDLAKNLENKPDVHVRLPDPVKLVSGFCEDFEDFLTFVESKPIVRLLADRTVIDQFYEIEDAQED